MQRLQTEANHGLKLLEQACSRAQNFITSTNSSTPEYAKHVTDTLRHRLDELRHRVEELEAHIVPPNKHYPTQKEPKILYVEPLPLCRKLEGRLARTVGSYRHPQYTTVTSVGALNSPVYVVAYAFIEVPLSSAGTGRSVKAAHHSTAYSLGKQIPFVRRERERERERQCWGRCGQVNPQSTSNDLAHLLDNHVLPLLQALLHFIFGFQ